MKKICKIICWILGIFMGFIFVNLIIGTIKYGGTKNYSQILNQKDWQQSLTEVSLLKPKTRVSIFYGKSSEDTEKGVEESLLNEVDTKDVSDINDIFEDILSGDNNGTQVNRNPYDPDYEDEFNSFFGGTSQDTPEIISVEEIENLEPAGFVVDENTED